MCPIIVADPWWEQIAVTAGGVAAAVAVIGGPVAALFYGRTATIQVSAEAHIVDGDVLVSVRPTVRTLGFLRLKFDQDAEALARVTEVLRSPEGQLTDGRPWVHNAVFGEVEVDRGESVSTTVLFNLGPAPPNVVGWRVVFGASVGRWPRPRGEKRRVFSWDDQVFIPRPAVAWDHVETRQDPASA